MKEDYYRIVSKEEFYEKRGIEPHMVALWGWNGYPHYIGRPFEQFCEKNGITDVRQIRGIKESHYKSYGNLLRLQRLSGLDLTKVEFTHTNYADYEHQEGDVVYCDPPYANTDARGCNGNDFDSDAFWEWVRTRDYPVYVSE